MVEGVLVRGSRGLSNETTGKAGSVRVGRRIFGSGEPVRATERQRYGLIADIEGTRRPDDSEKGPPKRVVPA